MRTRRLLLPSLSTIALAAAFLANGYALASFSAHLRPLFLDGAYWLMDIIQWRRPTFDPCFLRYLDDLIHWPTVWVLDSFGGTRDAVPAALRVFCLSYTFHPILGLLASWAILRRRRRLDLMIFPVLSLCLATEMSLGFAVGNFAASLTVFWPLFLLTLLQDERPSPLSEAAAVALLCGLAFGYEPGFILTAILASVSFARFRASRSRGDRGGGSAIFAVNACLGGISTIWLIFRIYIARPGASKNAAESLLSSWDMFRGYALGLILLFSAWAGVVPRLSERRARALTLVAGILLVLLTGALLAGFARDPERQLALRNSYLSRVFSIPFAALLAMAAALISKAGKDRIGPFTGWARALERGFVCAALLSSAVYLAGTTKLWSVGIENLRQKLASTPGCWVAGPEEYRESWGKLGISDWSFTDLTLLVGAKRDIASIGFAPGFAKFLRVPDPCLLLKSGWLPELHHSRPLAELRDFDFSKALGR